MLIMFTWWKLQQLSLLSAACRTLVMGTSTDNGGLWNDKSTNWERGCSTLKTLHLHIWIRRLRTVCWEDSAAYTNWILRFIDPFFLENEDVYECLTLFGKSQGPSKKSYGDRRGSSLNQLQTLNSFRRKNQTQGHYANEVCWQQQHGRALGSRKRKQET